ncbi:hypothetical protein C7974DRAFT_380830 [Boeremia exigua]|uniref:uncharacterized protein n=1 Tax=Boeremia exigua TaxID=749465 RepID=UPI001E8D6380|nr:uncharacterized protein C7974DRAFT_380830 [Boeremia exigua]KAH6613117.1 hypothetical protein C7974DRAFT_380830 [Boeremia exigua]
MCAARFVRHLCFSLLQEGWRVRSLQYLRIIIAGCGVCLPWISEDAVGRGIEIKQRTFKFQPIPRGEMRRRVPLGKDTSTRNDHTRRRAARYMAVDAHASLCKLVQQKHAHPEKIAGRGQGTRGELAKMRGLLQHPAYTPSSPAQSLPYLPHRSPLRPDSSAALGTEVASSSTHARSGPIDGAGKGRPGAPHLLAIVRVAERGSVVFAVSHRHAYRLISQVGQVSLFPPPSLVNNASRAVPIPIRLETDSSAGMQHEEEVDTGFEAPNWLDIRNDVAFGIDLEHTVRLSSLDDFPDREGVQAATAI